MAANSLVKFANRSDGNGRGKLYWGRVGVDGLPFRGPQPPTFTEEEFEERAVRVADPHNGTYHTWIEEENAAYLDVLDKVSNGWGAILFQDTWKEKVKLHGRVQQQIVHYVVWVEYFMEDGSRARTGYGQPVEMSHGSPYGTAHPFPGAS